MLMHAREFFTSPFKRERWGEDSVLEERAFTPHLNALPFSKGRGALTRAGWQVTSSA
jgi:hypothetical protein